MFINQVSESEFYMWRTLFAMSHADDIVTEEERRFMRDALDEIAFSPDQRMTLLDDMDEPQDILEMFSKIGDAQDQARFFKFARELVHIDGDYGSEEQKVMLELISKHVKDVDFDALVKGPSVLSFEDERGTFQGEDLVDAKKDKRSVLSMFRDQFTRK